MNRINRVEFGRFDPELRTMIQLSDVQVFLEIVSAGSFTAAAHTLKMPKSSVARQIARLEQEVGCALLDRSTRVVVLTEDGRNFLPHARRLLDDGIEAQMCCGSKARAERAPDHRDHGVDRPQLHRSASARLSGAPSEYPHRALARAGPP